jgi:putative membrane protein
MRNSIIAIALGTGMAMVAGAAFQADAATESSSHQKAFMTTAIQGDMAEVQMGKLAQERGASAKVKQFGQTLVTDHSANLDKAKQVASSLNITPPSQPSSKEQAVYEKVSKLSGPSFDRAFAKDMVRDHEKDIAMFKKEAKGSGPVAQYAQQTLPTLHKHLQIAESIEGHK